MTFTQKGQKEYIHSRPAYGVEKKTTKSGQHSKRVLDWGATPLPPSSDVGTLEEDNHDDPQNVHHHDHHLYCVGHELQHFEFGTKNQNKTAPRVDATKRGLAGVYCLKTYILCFLCKFFFL